MVSSEEHSERKLEGIKGWLKGAPSGHGKVEEQEIRAQEATGAKFDSLRVAILPLSNMSPDPNDQYFADGMTEELISTMSRMSELSVISRTSIMQYKNQSKAIKEIGKELDAGTILEGSVRRVGNRVRITIQMIDSALDKHIWAESYDRELSDVFFIQSDVSQKVAEALKIKLLPSEKKALEKATESTEAYTLYLKGRYHLNERKRDSTNKAVNYFENAIKIDPTFAQAYAALANCFAVYADYSWLRPKESFPRAKEYAMKALKLNPNLAEAHVVIGAERSSFEHKWDEGERAYKEAIALNPSYAMSYHWYSLMLRFMGRLSESYEPMRRAAELDPLSRVIQANLAEVLFVNGNSKDAIELFNKVIEENPDYSYAHMWLGWSYYLGPKKPEEAIAELRKSVANSHEDPFFKAQLGCLLGFNNNLEEANEIVKEVERSSKATYVDNGITACALVGAGRIDDAFRSLEKACEERSQTIPYINWWPWLEQIRKDQRWHSIQERIGL